MTATSRAIAVTGLRMITPAGADAAATWERVRLGFATADRDTRLKGMTVDFSCRVPESADQAARIGRKSWRMPRFAQLAVVAAREAVAGLDPTTWDGARGAVVIGSGLAGVSHLEEQPLRLHRSGPERVSAMLVPQLISNMAAGEVSLDLGARGPSMATETACASGATAIAVARDLLLAGRATSPSRAAPTTPSRR